MRWGGEFEPIEMPVQKLPFAVGHDVLGSQRIGHQMPKGFIHRCARNWAKGFL